MYSNINLLINALDASWKRNEVITNNIANAETPNFKKSTVSFEEILKEQLSGEKLKGIITNAKHIPIN
ncbi:MAG TPA: flagellar basal body protein, partial [Oscillospiraceae bacterium]|nr:flagellar basal body protein [Oscillospiraceae bacterium]